MSLVDHYGLRKTMLEIYQNSTVVISQTPVVDGSHFGGFNGCWISLNPNIIASRIVTHTHLLCLTGYQSCSSKSCESHQGSRSNRFSVSLCLRSEKRITDLFLFNSVAVLLKSRSNSSTIQI